MMMMMIKTLTMGNSGYLGMKKLYSKEPLIDSKMKLLKNGKLQLKD